MKNLRSQSACANCKHSIDLCFPRLSVFEEDEMDCRLYCMFNDDEPKQGSMGRYEFRELQNEWRENSEVGPHMICDLYEVSNCHTPTP